MEYKVDRKLFTSKVGISALLAMLFGCICLFGSVATLCAADPLTAEESAPESIQRFRRGFDALPERVAAITRLKFVILPHKGEVSSSEQINLYAEDKGFIASGKLCSCQSIAETSKQYYSWGQKLRRDGILVSRNGTPVRQFASERFEPSDLPADESKIRFRLGHPHPYFLPFALQYEVTAGRVQRQFAETLKDQYAFISAKRVKEGVVSSVWSYKTRRVLIDFDPRCNGLPTQITYYGAKNKHIPHNQDHVEGMHQIRWKKHVMGESELWLPIWVRKHASSLISRRDFEMEGIIQWMQFDDSFKFPDIGDSDWRKPFLELFDEDWTRSYQEWQRILAMRDD